MLASDDDDIDAYGLDTFSPEFLVKLSQAEEAFPSSFGALPPATETSSEDEFDVEDMLLTQEMHDALDEMENSYTASQYAAKSQCSERDSSDDEGLVAEREPETVIGTKRKRADEDSESDSDFSDDDLNLYTPALPHAASTRSSSPTLLGSGSCSASASRSPSPSPAKPAPLPARTHLTQFFASYPAFHFDPTQSASPQFTQLIDTHRFSALEKAAARRAYSRAMCLTFSDLYGEDADSLENWWKLCRAVQIEPPPRSVEGCKAAMDAVHVNILDLTERLDAQVHRFPSERALAHYTVSEDRRFPLSRAHKSPLLSLLLRRIHDPPSDSESESGPRRRPLKRRRQEGPGYAGDDAWE